MASERNRFFLISRSVTAPSPSFTSYSPLPAKVLPVNETPEQFAATMRADYDKWTRLVKELNIKGD